MKLEHRGGTKNCWYGKMNVNQKRSKEHIPVLVEHCECRNVSRPHITRTSLNSTTSGHKRHTLLLIIMQFMIGSIIAGTAGCRSAFVLLIHSEVNENAEKVAAAVQRINV